MGSVRATTKRVLPGTLAAGIAVNAAMSLPSISITLGPEGFEPSDNRLGLHDRFHLAVALLAVYIDDHGQVVQAVKTTASDRLPGLSFLKFARPT